MPPTLHSKLLRAVSSAAAGQLPIKPLLPTELETQNRNDETSYKGGWSVRPGRHDSTGTGC